MSQNLVYHLSIAISNIPKSLHRFINSAFILHSGLKHFPLHQNSKILSPNSFKFSRSAYSLKYFIFIQRQPSIFQNIMHIWMGNLWTLGSTTYSLIFRHSPLCETNNILSIMKYLYGVTPSNRKSWSGKCARLHILRKIVIFRKSQVKF